MYEHERTRPPIRDAAPRYGADDLDRFPADEVLADLPLAEGADATARIQRILARYAALRTWLLRLQAAPPALTRHARDAARIHLAAVAEALEGAEHGWAEGDLLRRLLQADLPEAASLLAAAAGEAARTGDGAGAAALRGAAREATLLRLGGGGPEALN